MSESHDKGRFGLRQATPLNMTNMIGIGWYFLFVTSDPNVITAGPLALLLGVAPLFVCSWRTKGWPFAEAAA